MLWVGQAGASLPISPTVLGSLPRLVPPSAGDGEEAWPMTEMGPVGFEKKAAALCLNQATLCYVAYAAI